MRIYCLDCEVVDAQLMGVRLCKTCYQRNRRNSTLWMFPDINLYDSSTMSGAENLDDLVRWVYEFDFNYLVSGLSELEEYSTITYALTKKGRHQVGFGGYGAMDGEYVCCFECGEHEVHSRGLCKQCYNGNAYQFMLGRYPTDKYVSNVKGYVYWLLEHHLQLVIDIGTNEFGVEFEFS